MNRRGFLKAASLAPAAAAVGAQQLSSMAVADTGMARMRMGVSAIAGRCGGEISQAASPDYDGFAAWVLKNGFPEHWKREARMNAKYVSAFDPDLAANRSMSLPAKLHIQRQRNYESILAGRDPNIRKEDEFDRKSFFEKWNFWG